MYLFIEKGNEHDWYDLRIKIILPSAGGIFLSLEKWHHQSPQQEGEPECFWPPVRNLRIWTHSPTLCSSNYKSKHTHINVLQTANQQREWQQNVQTVKQILPFANDLRIRLHQVVRDVSSRQVLKHVPLTDLYLRRWKSSSASRAFWEHLFLSSAGAHTLWRWVFHSPVVIPQHLPYILWDLWYGPILITHSTGNISAGWS